MPCEYFLLIRRQRRPCLLAIDDGLSLAGQHACRGNDAHRCVRGFQRQMKASCLSLSDDHSSFYVGHAFTGRVDQYSVDTGELVCCAEAHHGDVHTLTVVQPDVVCTSGSDGRLRLLDTASGDWTAPPLDEPAATPVESFSDDERAYRQVRGACLRACVRACCTNVSTVLRSFIHSFIYCT